MNKVGKDIPSISGPHFFQAEREKKNAKSSVSTKYDPTPQYSLLLATVE